MKYRPDKACGDCVAVASRFSVQSKISSSIYSLFARWNVGLSIENAFVLMIWIPASQAYHIIYQGNNAVVAAVYLSDS